MLGIFDSGRGGQNVLAALRALAPLADIAYFADTLGAPYGTKSRQELIERILHDENILSRAGCSHILIGCCTASTLHDALPRATRERLFPIVDATAREAVAHTLRGRIGVLCTNASAASDAFGRCIRKYDPDAYVLTAPSQAYVGLAEDGRIRGDDAEFKKQLTASAHALKEGGVDTVILGCTHFHPLTPYLKEHLPSLCVISSTEVGARAFLSTLPRGATAGDGITVYL